MRSLQREQKQAEYQPKEKIGAVDFYNMSSNDRQKSKSASTSPIGRKWAGDDL